MGARAQALRARALVQHAQSFSAVYLPAMAATFACSAECAPSHSPAWLQLPGSTHMPRPAAQGAACMRCTGTTPATPRLQDRLVCWDAGLRPHAASRELEAELVRLIKDGQVAGRIDNHAGVLYARRSDARRDSFQTALAAGAAAGAAAGTGKHALAMA